MFSSGQNPSSPKHYGSLKIDEGGEREHCKKSIEYNKVDDKDKDYKDDDYIEEYFKGAEKNESIGSHSLSIIANTTNALLGVSIFTVPWGFQQSGLLGGATITIAVALISFETIRILLNAQRFLFQRTGDVKGYPEIASASLGPTWSTVVQTATVVSCLGGCVGYLIFFGEITSQLFSISLTNSVMMATFPLVLLSWIRSFREMTVFTVTGVAAIILAIGVIIFDGSNGGINEIALSHAPLFIPRTALNFLGPSTFTFTIHYCVLAMGAEAMTLSSNISNMTGTAESTNECTSDDIETEHRSPLPKQPPQNSINSIDSMNSTSSNKSPFIAIPSPIILVHTLTRPLAMSFVLSCVMIIPFGIVGVIYFGETDYVRNDRGEVAPGCEDHVCQNVILNLSNGYLKSIVGSALCLAIVFSYILILAPAREHIETATLKVFGESWSDPTREGIRNLLRTFLVILTAAVAIGSPYFGTVLGTVGGLTDALQSFVLPPIICLRIFKGQLLFPQRFFLYLVFFWGIVTILYTMFQITQVILND